MALLKGLVVNLDTAYSPYLRAGSLLIVANAMVVVMWQASAFKLTLARSLIISNFQARGPPGGGRGGARGGRGGGRGGYGGGGAPQAQAQKFMAPELKQLMWLLKGQKVRVTHRSVSL